MARAVLSHPVATGGSVLNLRRDGLKDLFYMGPRGGIAAGHDRGPTTRALFPTRHTRANEKNSFLGKSCRSTIAVGKQRVAAVDDDVAGLQMRQNRLNLLVD